MGYRHLPLQPRESRIVTIEGDPLAAPLDGECGEPGISDARSSRVGLDAQAFEYVPMAFAGLDNLAVWLPKEILAEPERLFEQARHSEGTPIRRNPDNGAQHR